ncbi:hypothetical protein ILUMI_00033 [Ignelater luminosus]|uniref:Uncharacterized protein n=1 Tax=Ignelater luminosus TaxID=2038154 RepID=A0A8K0DMP1_IGNLU|nr:hypothetical protein ILUMI_00033 [Ignelater luminosus]
MMQTDDSDGSGRAKIITRSKKRREGQVPVSSIEDNLKTINNNSKKRAQDRYYGNTGQSPLVRSIANLQQNSKPVHERLGQTTIVLRRTRHAMNNTAAPRLQKRLRRTNVRNISNNNNNRTLVRRSANQRLARIRYQQGIDNFRQALQTQTIRLRRRKPIPPVQQPTNFLVQVDNPSFGNQVHGSFMQHSIQSSIDPSLQAQIRLIQSQSNFDPEINIIASQPIFVPGNGFTHVFLNERFARLP